MSIQARLKTWRIFLAVELPGSVKTELAHLVDMLKSHDIRGLRPVDPNGIHLTLKFLGEVQIECIKVLVQELAPQLATYEPFVLELGHPGVFPNRAGAKVLWLGLNGDIQSLGRLQQVMQGVVDHLGHLADGLPFLPHLTVARLSGKTYPGDRRMAVDILFSAQSQTAIPIPVQSVSLMRSISSSAGIHYLCLARFPMARKAI